MKKESARLLSLCVFGVGILFLSNLSAQTYVYRINCGGSAVSPFTADQYSTSGSTYSSANTIVTTGVVNVAPMAVYQTERYGTMSYTFPNLTAGASYTVRLHFAEVFFSTAGSRVFNVKINGVQKLTNFDIYAAAGAKNKALVRDFTVTANTGSQIIIDYVSVTNNAKSSGIEIISTSSTTIPPSITTPPANLSVSAGNAATFSVVASGTAPLSYQWLRNSNTISGAIASSYTISSTTTADSGSSFSCRVSNSAGSVTSASATLTVVSIPTRSRPVIGAVTDMDGNVYRTIVIGAQEWTMENIRTTTLNNGTPIPNVSSGYTGVESVYCFYRNTTNPVEQKRWGALYSWSAVATGKLAPPPQAGTPAATDWHVPTYADWIALQNYLISSGYNYDGTTTGNKIAKSLATGYWQPWTTIAGVVGNNLSLNNRSGFSAFPAGFLFNYDFAGDDRNICYWWSSTGIDALTAYAFNLQAYDIALSNSGCYQDACCSVRLVRNVN